MTVIVVFSPSSSGIKNASLEITSDDPDEGVATVVLLGNGAGGQDISVDPTNIDFGEIKKGESSSPSVVTIENTGDADLSIISLTISGDNKNDFTIELDGGSNPIKEVPATIPAGGNATMTVTFSPSSSGEKSASFEITSDDPNEEVVIITLTGKGKEGGGCFLSSSNKGNRKK